MRAILLDIKKKTYRSFHAKSKLEVNRELLKPTSKAFLPKFLLGLQNKTEGFLYCYNDI